MSSDQHPSSASKQPIHGPSGLPLGLASALGLVSYEDFAAMCGFLPPQPSKGKPRRRRKSVDQQSEDMTLGNAFGNAFGEPTYDEKLFMLGFRPRKK